MKTPRSLLAAVSVFLVLAFTLRAGDKLAVADLGPLPAADGADYVEVNVSNNLIAMVARLAEKQEPQVADMLRGIKSVRVNVVGLTDQNRSEVEKKIKAIRAQLDAAGWERTVAAQKEKADVGVYVKTRGDEAVEGVVVTVIEGGQQAVLVNLVGDIKPEKLAMIGERFDLEPLKKLHIEPHAAGR